MPLRACGGGGEGICVGAPSAMSSAVSGTEFENTSALTRRSVGCYYPSVNCGPARRCLLPVLVPAEAWVRAEETTGTVLRGDGVLLPRFALVLCLPCSFIGMFCARSRILSRCCWGVWVGLRLLFDVNAKQDGLRYVSFLFRGGRERHSCVLAAVLGYLVLLVHFGIGRFFMAIPTEYDRSPFIRKEAPYRVALLSLWRACSL